MGMRAWLQRMIVRYLAFAAALVLISLASGCTNLEAWPFKTYAGPNLPRNQIAIIETRLLEQNYGLRSTETRICCFRGREVVAIEVRPGIRAVQLRRNVGYILWKNNTSSAQLTFDVKPGFNYSARSSLVEDVTWFWIEDSATGNVVAGKKPATQ